MPALVVDNDGSLCKADVLETMRLAQRFLSIVGSSRMPIIMVGMDKIDSDDGDCDAMQASCLDAEVLH